MTYPADVASTNAISALEHARTALAAEISGWPTPISGCVAQFNHLLRQRNQIRRAPEAMDGQVLVRTPRNSATQSGVESK